MKKYLLLALLWFAWTTSAAAENRMYTSLSSAQLQAQMQAGGYSFEVDEDGDLIWTLNGYSAYLIIAEDQQSVLLRMSFHDSIATIDDVNGWNRAMKYSRSYIDEVGDPVLELDLELRGGVSAEHIQQFLRNCRDSMTYWVRDVIIQ